MPLLPPQVESMMHLGRRLTVGAFVAGLLVSCAVKKNAPGNPPAAETGKPKPADLSASASPSPKPSPSPTPQVRYTATVRVDGGATTQADVTPADDQSGPSASASATASATASPSPTAPPAPSSSPKPGNFFADTWKKIFPPKPTATAAPSAAPTPIPRPHRPEEGLLPRTWHRIFPKKQAPPLAAPPQWIGTIKLVNEREGYVLIDAINAPTLAPGEPLNAIGNDRESGVLRTTADRNPPFFIADLVSGKPQPGDRVYSPQP